MNRMNALSIDTQADEQECQQAHMEEMYVHNMICEAAQLCANDPDLFTLFIREVHKNKKHS